MYKPQDFTKGCPVCLAVTKSKTKKVCDFCKSELIVFAQTISSFNSETGELKWKWISDQYKKEGD